MAFLSRKPSLPAPVAQALRTACRGAGVADRVLAVAPGPDRERSDGGTAAPGSWAVALTTHLGYGFADDWTLVPWHQVDRGSWNAETFTLEVDQRGTVEDGVVRPGGRRHRIRLQEPYRVPEVMAERVAATILFHRQLQFPGSAGVLTVTARRDLAAQTIEWLAVPGRGVRLADPDVREFAAAAIRRLRLQYG